MFDANGGIGNMTSQTIYQAHATNLNANTFEKDEYIFECWNTEPDGTGTNYADTQSVTDLVAVNSSITLYAQWVEVDGAAEVNGRHYATLQDAIYAAPNTGVQTVVKLLRNVSESVTISSGRNIIFDLQNKTITGVSSSKATIENSGTLLIQNGTITKNPSDQVAVINNNAHATLKITGGNIIAKGTTKAQAIYNNNASVEISGNAYITSESSNRATITNINNGTATITGGTIIAENYNAISNVPVPSTSRGGQITIGVENEDLNNKSPLIQAKEIGVETKYASVNFYNGIIKVQNTTLNSNYILDQKNGCGLLYGTETIDGVQYNTLQLQPNITVEFDPCNGFVSPTKKYYDDGDEIGELPVPTREGYEFAGWFTEADEGVQIDEHQIINADITYYAHWTKQCRITFHPNGGKLSDRIRDVYENDEVGSLPVPTKTNSTFIGWFTEKDGGTQITANSIVLDNVTYYAHWNGINVARINGVEYATLQDAIDDVPTDNTETTIEFLCDIVENVDTDPGQKIVFDIGNYTLSNARDNAVILNYGSIKIINGTITSSAGFATINSYTGATVEITGGNILGTGARQALYNKGGVVKISGNPYFSSADVATEKKRGTIHNLDGGVMTITGGTIVAQKVNAIYNESGIITIGTKDGNVSTSVPLIQSVSTGIRNESTINFYDGIVKVPSNKELIAGNINATENGYNIVNGTETIEGVQYKTAYLGNEITIPTPVSGLKYNGALQSGVVESNNYILTGNTATQAGTYTATASLKYPAISTWEDGTTADKTITYTINKAAVAPVATVNDKSYDGTTDATGTISLEGVVSGDDVTATATSYTFASPDIGTDIVVIATGIVLAGADSGNYELSSTTAETTADIT